MPRASEFNVAVVQAAIYTPDAAPFPQTRVLTEFLPEVVGRYDGVVTSLPIPPDAPPQLPRILLQSADNVWKLQISPARVDSLWAPPQPVATMSLREIVEQCGESLERYVRRYHPRVGRLALLLQRAVVVTDPAQVLVHQFCNDRSIASPLRHSDNFELHNHRKYVLPVLDLMINSWVRCKATARILGEPGIAVEQDINTLDEDMADSNFDVSMISSFMDRAQVEADEILGKYFP